MDCSSVGRVPPVATGRLHTNEALVLLGYVMTILLLLFGPASLCHRQFRKRGRQPPWFTEKTVYAPLCGVAYLSIINLLRGNPTSLVTAALLKEVFLSKYDIILLIQSFAYLSISLDISGFFRHSAVFIVIAARGNGCRLLVYLYILNSILTYFTSNDIVIISMTPLIIHIGNLAGIKNVIPLLVTQFIAANTAAMGMYIGSPTNIILGDAVHLTFSRYWLLMLLPTTTAIVGTLFMCQVVFYWCPSRGNAIQPTFTPLEVAGLASPSPSPSHGEPPHGLQLASLETPGGGIDHLESPPPASDAIDITMPLPASHPSTMTSCRTRGIKIAVFATVLILLSVSNFIKAPMWLISFVSALALHLYDLHLVSRDGASTLSFWQQVSQRMPWAIGPFVFCMFTMVRVLTNTGLTGRFAGWMIYLAGSTPLTHALAFAYLSSLLVNCLNDLPSTVFWSDMVSLFDLLGVIILFVYRGAVYVWRQCRHYSKKSYTVVIMSLLVGVNVGCYLSLIGALAGLMWSTIIRTQPAAATLKVPTGFDLTYYGLLVFGPVTFLCCLAITLVALAI